MEGATELDKHIPKVQQYLDALLGACKSKDGWVETGTKKQIYIDHKDIWDLIMDFSSWKEWDKMVLRVEVIEQRTLADGTICMIMYSAYASPAPLFVSHRDFVTLVLVRRTPEGDMLYAADSVEHPKLPASYPSTVGLGSNFVRGSVNASGSWTRATPGKEGTITMTYVVQVDPKGSIPTWIVNYVATSQPLNIAMMRDHIAEKKKKKKEKGHK